MRKEVRSGKTSRQVGWRIVEAWFDTVINPLLRALETEQRYLAQKNWTWQFQPGGLEFIRPVRVHVSSRENLKQFLELCPEVNRSVKEHDKKVSLLLEKCWDLHRAVEGSSELREVYERVTSPAALAKLPTTRHEFLKNGSVSVESYALVSKATLADLFGAYPEPHHLDVLAEHIVNNKGELPPYYTIAPLWNTHRGEFLAILDRPAIRKHHQATMRAGKALLRSVEQLKGLLEKTRLELSLEHDVPYEPPERLNSSRATEFDYGRGGGWV